MTESNATELLGYLEPYDEQARAKSGLLQRLLDLQNSKRPNNRKRKMPADPETLFNNNLNKEHILFRLSTIEQLWNDWLLNAERNEEVRADVLALAHVTGDKSKALKLALYPEIEDIVQNKRLYVELIKHILRQGSKLALDDAYTSTPNETKCQAKAKKARLMFQHHTYHQDLDKPFAQGVSSSPSGCQMQETPLQLSRFIGRKSKPDPFLSAMLASNTWFACCELDRGIDITACMFKIPIYGSIDWIVGMYWSVAWGLRYISSTAVPARSYNIPIERLPEDWQGMVKTDGWSIRLPCDHRVGDAICYVRVYPNFGLLAQLHEVTKPEFIPDWLA